MKKLLLITICALIITLNIPTFAAKKKEKETKPFSISQVFDIMEGLPSNNITCLALQGDIIWAGTDKGIACYNKVPEYWIVYTTNDGLLGNYISAIGIGKDEIWASTDKGISIYTERDGWRPFVEGLKSRDFCMSEIKAIEIEEDNEGLKGDNIWFGVTDGLWKFELETRSFKKILGVYPEKLLYVIGYVDIFIGDESEKEKLVGIETIKVIDKNIWIASIKGLIRVDDDKNWVYCRPISISPFKLLTNYFYVSHLSMDKDMNILLSTFGDLYQLKPRTLSPKMVMNGLRQISALECDENHIWVATKKCIQIPSTKFFELPKAKSGLDKLVQLDRQSFKILYKYDTNDGLPESSITSILSYGDKVWLGTKDDGIILFEKNIKREEAF